MPCIAHAREQPLVEYLEAVMGSNALRQGIDARGRKMLEKRLKGMQVGWWVVQGFSGVKVQGLGNAEAERVEGHGWR